MIEIEDICEPEWAAWYRMTPRERWEETSSETVDGEIGRVAAIPTG